jgi:hypothetical protein
MNDTHAAVCMYSSSNKCRGIFFVSLLLIKQFTFYSLERVARERESRIFASKSVSVYATTE